MKTILSILVFGLVFLFLFLLSIVGVLQEWLNNKMEESDKSDEETKPFKILPVIEVLNCFDSECEYFIAANDSILGEYYMCRNCESRLRKTSRPHTMEELESVNKSQKYHVEQMLKNKNYLLEKTND